MTDTHHPRPDVPPVPFAEEGDGPIVLVLIPEGGADRDALGVVAHYLAEEAGFRVVRVGSRAGAEATTSERVDDIASVMDRIGLARAWVGGHGAGGIVARAFAAEHADRVNGLLLLGVEADASPLPPVIPVLVIQGADDEVTPASNGRRLQATAPERTSVTSIAGAGHLFPLTHPVETAVIIEEYLDWD